MILIPSKFSIFHTEVTSLKQLTKKEFAKEEKKAKVCYQNKGFQSCGSFSFKQEKGTFQSYQTL